MKTVERQFYSKDSLGKMIGGKMYGSVASGRSGQVGHVGHLVWVGEIGRVHGGVGKEWFERRGWERREDKNEQPVACRYSNRDQTP